LNGSQHQLTKQSINQNRSRQNAKRHFFSPPPPRFNQLNYKQPRTQRVIKQNLISDNCHSNKGNLKIYGEWG
jgi:hypothetical protein